MINDPRGALTRQSSTLTVLTDTGPFHGLTHRFGVSEQFSLLRNPKVRLCVIHPHLPFWPILARFMGYYLLFWSILTHFVDYYSPFWGPGAIFMVAEPNVSLRVVHRHSPFWPILA